MWQVTERSFRKEKGKKRKVHLECDNVLPQKSYINIHVTSETRESIGTHREPLVVYLTPVLKL